MIDFGGMCYAAIDMPRVVVGNLQRTSSARIGKAVWHLGAGETCLDR